ncbi:MAG: hypothetical protein QOJ54_130 [Aliidongia sp.]|jgi:hypothetical protein|nr:hypothetical protein [Aliidongia sp.]
MVVTDYLSNRMKRLIFNRMLVSCLTFYCR